MFKNIKKVTAVLKRIPHFLYLWLLAGQRTFRIYEAFEYLRGSENIYEPEKDMDWKFRSKR